MSALDDDGDGNVDEDCRTYPVLVNSVTIKCVTAVQQLSNT